MAKKNAVLAGLLFWLHLPIVLIWFGLFLIPRSVWPARVTVHFWYIASIMLIQLAWSLVIYRKVNLICPLTTWLQYVRGYPLYSRENYQHSFISELFERYHVKMSFHIVNVLLLITLAIVAVQYVLLLVI
jgi:hypothetical protein